MRISGLMLSGHTHGGQICLPGSIPITLESVLPRRMGAGAWQYHGMIGYTSVGAGIERRSGAPQLSAGNHPASPAVRLTEMSIRLVAQVGAEQQARQHEFAGKKTATPSAMSTAVNDSASRHASIGSRDSGI